MSFTILTNIYPIYIPKDSIFNYTQSFSIKYVRNIFQRVYMHILCTFRTIYVLYTFLFNSCFKLRFVVHSLLLEHEKLHCDSTRQATNCSRPRRLTLPRYVLTNINKQTFFSNLKDYARYIYARSMDQGSNFDRYSKIYATRAAWRLAAG